MTAPATSGDEAVRYRFGGSGRTGVLLGLGVRQSVPLIAGCLWLTLGLMAGLPWLGLAGPLAGAVVSFGRWRRSPLYDVAVPASRLTVVRLRRGRGTWVRRSLTATTAEGDLPPALACLDLLEMGCSWDGTATPVGMVRDRRAQTVSLVLPATASGFAVSSLAEQDALIAEWAAALGPLARERRPVVRVTWQHWTHPAGLDGHRRFLAALPARDPASAAAVDYEALLASQAPVTIGREVLVTLTVDLRRVAARQRDPVDAAVETMVDEARLLAGRLDAAGVRAGVPWSAVDIATGVRMRSDPARLAQLHTLRRSLAAATGRGTLEWGPLAVRPEWTQVWVDGSVHRSFRVAGWPMLPVPADWLAPLLSLADVTATVTVVLEPVPLSAAAAAANRELTAIEADQAHKERHGFRLTARERRRQHDVEAREQELAAGHPEFRHTGFVTVSASSLNQLEEASARVEQAAAQALLDVRVLAARQAEGWVCGLPLGRNVRPAVWR